MKQKKRCEAQGDPCLNGVKKYKEKMHQKVGRHVEKDMAKTGGRNETV